MSVKDVELFQESDLTLRVLGENSDINIEDLINSALTELDLDVEKSFCALETAVSKEEGMHYFFS